MLLGGNDAIRPVPTGEAFSRLGTLIDQIHQTGAAVILVGVRGGILGDSYRSEFEKLAKEKQVNYIPNILRGIFARPHLMADQIHPNDDGNALMADRIEPLLRQLLQ